SETWVPSCRGAGSLSSTLEKLKGFRLGPGDAKDRNNNRQSREVEKKEKLWRGPGPSSKKLVGDHQLFPLMYCDLNHFNEPGESRGGGRGPPGESGSTLETSAPCKIFKSAYTPLEQQYLQIKEQHKDVLLAVECGYKYRFFGDDAEKAAKELNIFCHLDHHFMTCSIPAHRLFVHVRRLVSLGHKVGLVKQTETSAIKASGASKNSLFTRQLSALYTKSTLIGEGILCVSLTDVVTDPPESYLLCLSETWDKNSRQLTIGLMAVQPSTGDVVFDCFVDNSSRSELEGRVLKVNPVEILVASDLSDSSHRLLQSIATASVQAGDVVRIEKRDNTLFDFASAMNTVNNFYSHTQEIGSRSFSSVASLESPVICCLGPLIHYLREFNLEKVLLHLFQHLSCETNAMVLSATTLRNLEIFTNNVKDVRIKYSFFSLQAKIPLYCSSNKNTPSPPSLYSQRSICERQQAVCEILDSDSITLPTLKALMSRLPDLERGICSIYHKKCSTQEFYLINSNLSRLGLELQALLPSIQSQLSSSLLRGLLLDTPDLLAPAHNFLKVLSEKAAKSGDKMELFYDLSVFPVLQERREEIQSVLAEIQDHLREVQITLRTPTVNYVTVSGQEFLVEVKNSMKSVVPSDWVQISSTKAVSRYQSPYLVEKCRRLSQLKEKMLIDSKKEWTNFLNQFGEYYYTMKKAVCNLATIDCLYSFAEVGKLTYSNTNGDRRRTMIITGPNMGGKSSYIRQVALLCIMAQVGSYVPATEASLGILDGIYTRMGASENIYKGRSTFMEELTETSEIVAQASERSLVILDELGRGTSTHDGTAIAYATLEYFIREVKSLTLFVTHYPPLCELEKVYPRHVGNFHMAFLLNEPEFVAKDGELKPDFITFLYQLTEGAAGRSYGLNVAGLADIPEDVLHIATCKAQELENTINSRSFFCSFKTYDYLLTMNIGTD
uniref:DNA mismatch repair protein MSH3 n=1 Tax=Esox lucius TaxID=8010 RepID=A0A3P8Z955_ESOLU